MRLHLFEKVMKLSTGEKDELHSSDIAERFEADICVVSLAITESLPRMAVSSLQLLAAAVILFFFNKWLCISIIITTPLLLTAVKIPIERIQNLTRQIRHEASSIHSFIQEHIYNRIIVKSLEREDYVTRQLSYLQSTLKSKVEKRTRMSTISSSMSKLILSSGYLTAFLWGTVQLATGEITFGVMAAFLQLVGLIQRPLTRMGSDMSAISKLSIAIERLEELKGFKGRNEDSIKVIDKCCGVRLRRVTFSYPGQNKQIFKDFSAEFLPESVYAVTGPSGSGKTTLLKLIMALHPVEEGEIQLFTDTENISISKSTRGNIAFIPQGNSLFSGSLLYNILLGNPDASADDIKEAIYCSMSDEILEHLPEGLDTVIGEKGIGLSEGEAQRIAVARGLLRKGRILLLDEPTSALNETISLEMIRRIITRNRTRTIIIVTHNPVIASLCHHSITLS